jgi:RHS repeat-associated protein
LRAQDADGDELTFRLDAAPAGVTIELVVLKNAAEQVVDRFYQVQWAVPLGAAGTSPTVTVVADDGRGGEAMQTWTLNVAAANAVNGAPTISSVAPTTARLGLDWIYRVAANDPNGDLLGYALLQKPEGMQVSAAGVVSWSVPADAPATVPVELQVSDGRGGLVTQKFDLRIVAIERNNAPTITSVPRQQSVTGQLYAYDPVGRDPEGDPLRWSLTAAPRGMSIDPATGNIRWTPDDQQLGTHIVAVTATDPFLAQFTQRFEVHVGCNNIAPAIVSIPPTTAITGRTYLYPVRAEDLERDPLAWQLTTAPAGMSIDASTGVIRWSPTAAQVATHNVVIEVSDGFNTATQRYSVVASNSDELVDANDPTKGTKGNRAPLITSTPKFAAEVDSLYTYQVTSIDPDGDNVTFGLAGNSPAGMTINAAGLIAWTPSAADVGEFVINVNAVDAHGATATQGYLLSVTVNSPPRITSTPIETAISGATYRYSVRATDPEGDPLTYRLDTAPSGMTIDKFGRILWASPVTITAPQPVTVTVADNRGQSASQSFTITMVADTQPPRVSLDTQIGGVFYIGDTRVDVGSNYTVRVVATDNVAVADVGLLVNGQRVTLDASGTISLPANTLGTVQLQATATDTSGLQGTATATVTVVDPAGKNQPVPTDPTLPPHPGFAPGDTGAPIVIITSPEPASTVSNLVPIIGTVDDPEDNLWYYRVYYARADRVSIADLDDNDPDWILLKESTQEVIDGELAVFDPSLVSNDPYALIVAAYDVNGRGFIQPTILYVEGNVQVGNFRLEFTDLSIPLAGIPIQVSRVYDTVTAGDEGDFGYGWSLGVQDARILEVAAVGPGGSLNGGNDKFIPDKTKVYLTNPSGQRVGFTYKEQLISASFFGGIWRPYFQADPGVYDTLTIDETQVARGGIVGALAQGINPNEYTLTTKSGLKYRYSETVGLQTITDLNGNVATFTVEGITHSSGQSIQFVRDHRGRIKEIVDPAGNAIQYEYDLAGDLVSVVDRVFAETEFKYLPDPAHYLDEYIDSLGRMAAKNEYDDDGRLIATVTSDGKRIEFDHDVDGQVEIVRDLKGLPSTYFYDAFGNVTKIVNAMGEETSFTFDANGNMLTETNGENETVTMTYDSAGNTLSRTDDLGNMTSYAYRQNRITAVTDPMGGVYAYQYDAKGNLISDTDANGNTRTFAYDASGNVVSSSDRLGNVTTFEYDGTGHNVAEIDAMGHRTEYTYDALGNRTSTVRIRTDANGMAHAVMTETEYDAEGRPVMVRDAMGNESTFAYRPDGLVAQETDIRGVTGIHQYDAQGNRIRSEYSDGSFEAMSYDANGNLLERRDRSGTLTRNEFDDANREKMIVDPYGRTTMIEYDLAGRQKTIESAGTTAHLEHDSGQVFAISPNGDSPIIGRPRISSVTIEGGEYVVDLEYDANGNIVGVNSSDGKQLTTSFTGTNLPTSFKSGSETNSKFALDVNGQPMQVTDQNGVTYSYQRDIAGRITEVTDPLGSRTRFVYDEVGNKMSQTDAENKTTRWEYDDAGHVTKRTLPLGQNETFEYSQVGDLIGHTNFNGQRTEYEYDLQGRVTKKTSVADGRVFEFDYDNAGRMLEVRDSRGSTRFAYDDFSRVQRVDNPDGSFIAYGYDDRGNRTSLTTASGTVNYTYDTLNRLGTVTDIDGAVATYSYDVTARSTTIDLPNGTSSTYVLDTMDRTVSIVHRDPSGIPFAQYDVAYETAGVNERIINELNGREVTYTYDELHRLVREQVVDPVSDDETTSYTYDKVGNRLTKTDSTGTTAYNYDNNHRLLTAGNATYTYDNNGNVTSKTDASGTTVYKFNSDNQLVQISLPDGTLISYEYDYDGDRITESSAGHLKSFVVDKEASFARVIQETSRSTVTRYLYGDRLLLDETNGVKSFHHDDPLGSTRLTTQEDGLISRSSWYDAFGNSFADGLAYGFLNENTDSLTGLIYLRSRYAESETGRFVSMDPHDGEAYDPRSLNSYVYGNSDPTTFIDPSGEFAIALLPTLLLADKILGYGAIAAAGLTAAAVAVTPRVNTHVVTATTFNGGLSFGMSSLGSSTSAEILFPHWRRPGPLYFSSEGYAIGYSVGGSSGINLSASVTGGTASNVFFREDYTGLFFEGSIAITSFVVGDFAYSPIAPYATTETVGIQTQLIGRLPILSITFAWRWYE